MTDLSQLLERVTPKQRAIIYYLRKCTGPASPTEIGEACGKPYRSASSWAVSGMKPLIQAGIIKRYEGGFYELSGISKEKADG